MTGQPETRDIRVLVVDDDEQFLELARDLLEAHDGRVRVRTAADAEAALEGLDGSGIDCVVSDHQLPGMSGLSLLDRVRERDADMPFVLFTGRGSEAVASRAISAGVTDYLQKGGPEQFERLANRVVHASAAHRARREAARLQSHFEAVVHNTTDAIVTIDDGGLIEFANGAVRDVFGHEPADLVGEPLATLVPERYLDRHERGLARYLETDDRQHDWRALEVHGRRADGSEVPLSVSFGEFSLAGERYVTGVLRDVSELEAQREALANEEAFVASVIDSIDELLVVLDREGRILRWNERVEAVTGLGDDDLLETPVGELFEPETAAKVDHALAEVLESGAATVDVAVDDVDDGLTPVEFRCRHLTDDAGRFLGICAVGRDVGDQRELEAELRESTERFRTLVEQNLVGIYVVRDGRIDYVNRRLAHLLGYEPEALVGTRPERLVAGGDPTEGVPSAAREVLAGERESFHETALLECRDGTLVDIETQATRIDLEGVPALLGTLVDVTSQKERRLRLQVLNRVLRHNLRTDMNVVLGRTELVRRATDDASIHENLQTVTRVGERLLERSEQARSVEQALGRSAADNEPVDLAALARAVAADVRDRFPAARVEVDLPREYIVAANAELEFAVRELVTNAVVHSDRAQPRVSIRLPDADEAAASLRRGFVVCDDGPGLPAVERAVLSAGEETPLDHGSGMGLWLVYWIVRSSGGDLAFADDEGVRGTRVVVSLPAAAPTSGADTMSGDGTTPKDDGSGPQRGTGGATH